MARPPTTRRALGSRLLLLLSSSLLSLLFLECGARIAGGEWTTTRNFLWSESFALGEASPALHDPELGWVPRPGASTRYRGKSVTIDERGLRSLGPAAPTLGQRRLLAVGDSYTFGSEVSDGETWPALLARRVDATVWNGGVFNYGIDQIVLRAEKLIAGLEPELVIASFIPSDVLRSELRLRGHAPKPWFEFENGSLVLRGVPVPTPPGRTERLGGLRSFLGHSYAIHRMMLRIAPQRWVLGAGPDQHAHRDGVAVSCALFQRLAARADGAGIRLALLAQTVDAPKRFARRSLVEALGPCFSRLEARGVAVFDLHPTFEELRARQPRVHARLFDGHMTPGGNAWVAQWLAERLVTLGWVSPREPATSPAPLAR